MSKYENDVKQLLTLIGGKENIDAVSHCMTRMRFVLNDPSKANEKEIAKIPSVKGTFTQAGQYQVIIGNDVSVFYNEFTNYAGIEGVSKDAVKNAAQTNQNIAQRIMGALGEIFAPIIPALICGGLILGFRNIIGEIYFFNNGTATLTQLYPFWMGVYNFLWIIGEAIFHLLPVGIVWSITKKMGTTQILGIVLGLTLVSPQLLNGFAVSSTSVSDIPKWDFGFIQIDMIGYQGQVIAAMMAGFVLVYLEKFFKKHCPEVISMIVVPFCSLVPAVIIAHTIVGPIGWSIGNFIGDIVYSGLTSNIRIIFAAIFGFVYAPIVMTGLHHMTNAIDTQLVTLYGGTMLWPMIALSNIAQGSAVLAMIVLQKKNERAEQINVPACISCYLGVTEPALFGVNLKYIFPLICGMIGSAIAAVISIGFGVEAVSIGVGGLPGILSIFSQYWGKFLLAMAAAIIVPFVLTIVVGKKKLPVSEMLGEAKEKTVKEQTDFVETLSENVQQKEESIADVHELCAILSGQVISIEEVEDDVFSQKIMGDGIAFEPSDEIVVAPCDATISVVMDGSKHACGMTLSNGMEILIHIGINTVNMNGDGFEAFVKAGDKVKRGQPLIQFSKEKIAKSGYSDTTMLIVTEMGNAKELQFHTNINAQAGKTVVAEF